MKIYLFLADGFEIVEGMTPIDVFRRADVDIETVSITDSLTVTCSRHVELKADCRLSDIDPMDGDALILPGGFPGFQNLMNNETVGETARRYYDNGRIVGAICGAPVILQHYGIARGSRITCHHSVRDKMTDFVYTGHDVEQDRNLITGIGAGHSFDFSLALLYALQGEEKVDAVKRGLEIN